MKTTNKCFTEQIQNHIKDILGTDETEVLTEQLDLVVQSFKDYLTPVHRKRLQSTQVAFADFLTCLPSAINAEYRTYYIHEILKEWFENCGQPYKEQSDDKAADLYYWLIFREIRNVIHANGGDKHIFNKIFAG